VSFKDIIERNNLKVDYFSISEDYGTEHFSLLLYSLIRMQRPNNIIELGAGYGTASILMGQALKDNEKGKIWCVDNQHDWPTLKNRLKIIGENFHSYDDYFAYLINKFKLNDYMEYENFNIDFKSHDKFFYTNEPIDILFSDAEGSDAEGIVKTLGFYLPKMSKYSDIFIDRASTIHHSLMTLESIVNCLQSGKIPQVFLESKTDEEADIFFNFVKRSKFTLINLAESPEKKVNQEQNSTAWLKIEPLNVFIGNQVRNYI
tara:strand:+ start:737 stop:1516 length:780 start_codon:yes stop_codon:yes gene_type:complete